MAQRPVSGSAATKSNLPSGYEDPNSQFDKRVALETKKVRELLNAVDNGRAQLEADRRAYCEDFKKFLVAYIADEQFATTHYVTSIQGIVGKLDELNACYQTAINHI